ncbi:hypothetical protein, partial [Myroides indicus]|uniref:hypothetical protein n=1 Tax=Myroides indicus TaxID=1323422 RepID=UPI001AAE68F7
LIICFVRCSNSDNSPTDETVISLFTDFKIMNNKGEDLLNPNTEGAFDQQKIRIKHLTKNGDFVMFYKSFLDCPYDFIVYTTIYDKTNTFALLNQVTNDYIIENKITAIIQWNEMVSDTIVTQVHRGRNNTSKTKVWVNGELKEDIHNGLTPEFISLIK